MWFHAGILFTSDCFLIAWYSFAKYRGNIHNPQFVVFSECKVIYISIIPLIFKYVISRDLEKIKLKNHPNKNNLFMNDNALDLSYIAGFDLNFII